MELYYGCVKLRAIEEGDAELLKLLINLPEVEQYTVGSYPPVSSWQQEQWIKSNPSTRESARWMVELKNGTTLGMVILKNVDWINRSGTIGYKRNPNERARMKGDMRDAVYATLIYAFDELNLHRVELGILAYNAPSIKLAEDMGFVKEGVQRSKIFKAGAWHDEWIFGLLRDEFVRYKDGEAPWQKKLAKE